MTLRAKIRGAETEAERWHYATFGHLNYMAQTELGILIRAHGFGLRGSKIKLHRLIDDATSRLDANLLAAITGEVIRFRQMLVLVRKPAHETLHKLMNLKLQLQEEFLKQERKPGEGRLTVAQIAARVGYQGDERNFRKLLRDVEFSRWHGLLKRETGEALYLHKMEELALEFKPGTTEPNPNYRIWDPSVESFWSGIEISPVFGRLRQWAENGLGEWTRCSAKAEK